MESARSSESGRRPISSRKWPIFQTVSRKLATSGVSPNVISVTGLVMAVLAGVCLAVTGCVESPLTDRFLWLSAGLLVQLRLLANLLDGMVAVESGKTSPLGQLYNEVTDRFADLAVLIGLGHAQGGEPLSGYLAGCLAILGAYVRTEARLAGAPQDYAGPMAKQHRMFVVTVVAVSLGVMPTNLSLHCPWMGYPIGVVRIGLAVIIAGTFIMIVRRLVHAKYYLEQHV